MSGTSLTFTECQLVINQNRCPKLSDFENKKEQKYEAENKVYIVNCEILQDNFFWIYIRYGKAKPYSNEVINIETKEISANKREANEAELRNQLFCMYCRDSATFYISNIRQSNFVSKYLQETFKKDFIVQNHYTDPEKFVSAIKSLKQIRFVSKDKNLFNSGIFSDVNDVMGYGASTSFTIDAQIKESNFDPKKCLDFLTKMRRKKENCEIDRMICIGTDDDKIEKIFNLETYLCKTDISIQKDINEMYDSELVKDNLLQKIGYKNDL